MDELTMVKENITAAKDFFEKYTAKFLKNSDRSITDGLILMKEHSLKVAELSAKIASNLQLEEDDIELAELIGLLHDIGRFAQFEKSETFDDRITEDHAETGLSLLNEQAFFTSIEEGGQNLITNAIRNHNKESISLKDDKRTILFSQILRDADKLDVWETCVANLQRNGTFRLESISWNLPQNGQVNDSITRQIKNGKPVRKKDVQSVNDFKLMVMSMVFDLNFRVSFQLLSEKQLIKKLYDSMTKKDVVIDAYREIRLFIENKIVD